MSMPLQQKIAVAKYIAGKTTQRREEVSARARARAAAAMQPSVRRLRKDSASRRHPAPAPSVEECIAAVEECGAPMVSIAGGEPLVHEQMPQIVEELVKRKKFVFLCTNALLLKKKIHLFKPSVYFAWMIHLDGMRERHDESVCREGVFDKAIDAIKEAKARGFRVFTNTTFFDQGRPRIDPRGARLPQRRSEGRHDADLAGLRVREGARPGALPGRQAHARDLQARPSPTASARSGASTTARSISISSKARSTSSARRGAFRATRSSAGSARAT